MKNVPMAIFTLNVLIRTMTTNGLIMLTFTPLEGPYRYGSSIHARRQTIVEGASGSKFPNNGNLG